VLFLKSRSPPDYLHPILRVGKSDPRFSWLFGNILEKVYKKRMPKQERSRLLLSETLIAVTHLTIMKFDFFTSFSPQFSVEEVA